jgi:hypothetical protein
VESQLLIYIPSYENFPGALAQAQSLQVQASSLQGAPWGGVRVVVSVNGCDYDTRALESAGACVLQRSTNLGGDANIALGFIEAQANDYLWILSDNDPVNDTALETLARAFLDSSDTDLVVGVSDVNLEGRRVLRSPVTGDGGNFHIGLISAVVYRWSSFVEATPAAFQSLWTGWGQIALQEKAVQSRGALQMSCVPLSSLVGLGRGGQAGVSVLQTRQKYSHSLLRYW